MAGFPGGMRLYKYEGGAMRRIVVVSMFMCMAAGPAIRAQVAQVCVNPQSGEIKAKLPCQAGWTQVALGGSPGGTLVAEHSWNTATLISQFLYAAELTDSGFTGVTRGGPLLVVVNTIFDGSAPRIQSACQPLVDGQWAGAYAPLADASGDALNYVEGVVVWQGGLQPWMRSRVYPGIPAGSHRFSLRCYADASGLPTGVGFASSLAVVELQ